MILYHCNILPEWFGCRRLFASITYATIVCCVGDRRNEQFNLSVVDFLFTLYHSIAHTAGEWRTAANQNQCDCAHSLRDVYYNNIGAHVANHLRRLDYSYYCCSRCNNNYHHYYSPHATRNKRTTTTFIIVRFCPKPLSF